MTHHYISRLTTAGTLAVMLSSAHTPLYDQDEVRSPGRTLPRLAAALRCYRAADGSDDLNERLRLQRNLADAAAALATQAELLNDARLLELMFRHAPTDTARRVRFALDELRVGLAGDQARLDFATAAFGRLAHEGASA